MTPNRIEVGFSQEVHGSPAAFPGGIRPDAIPPIAQANRKGVVTDARPKTRLRRRRPPPGGAGWRRATAPPGSTIPTPPRISAIQAVDITASKNRGKPVQVTTRTNTSQTLLASQT